MSESEVAINPVTRVRPLADEATTLAESFQARGYQTVALVANMIVTDASGLLQGFTTRKVTPSSLGLRGRKFRPAARELVAGLDPSKPLFLFVNLYDAHDPYPEVPADAGFVPAQPRVDLHPNDADPNNPYVRYVRGTMPEAERPDFLRGVVNGYDWGIHEADANLGFLLGLLEERGWLDDDARIAVTSDHGEMLGEHQLLRHGGFLWEGMVSVPLVLWDGTQPVPKLPEPVSGLVVHDWLLHGRVPEVPVTAMAERNEHDVLVGTSAAALWVGSEKAVCVDGERGRYDLAGDPGERVRLELSGGLAEGLEPWCAGVEALKGWAVPVEGDGMREALRAVGYVE